MLLLLILVTQKSVAVVKAVDQMVWPVLGAPAVAVAAEVHQIPQVVMAGLHQ
jgi:hypothetical protein